MAKVELNPLLKVIRGKIDKAVFRGTPSGEVTISKSPDMSGVVWSEAQDDHRMDMKKAFHYAKTAVDIPEMRDYYLAMARRVWNNNRPYNMAVRDYRQGNNRLKEFFVPGRGLVVTPAASSETGPALPSDLRRHQERKTRTCPASATIQDSGEEVEFHGRRRVAFE